MRSLWYKVKIITFAKWKEIIFLGFHSISILNLFLSIVYLNLTIIFFSYLKIGQKVYQIFINEFQCYSRVQITTVNDNDLH